MITLTVERLLLDLTPVPAFVCDLDTLAFLDVNAALIQLSGYARDELLAMHIDVDRAQLASDERCVVPLRTKGGHTVELLVQCRIANAVVVAIATASPSRLEALGRLAVGIAHDFNNVLGVIIANAEVARQEHPHSEELVEIELACEHAAALARQLLTGSHGLPIARSRVDPNAMLAELERMLRRLVGEHVVLSFEVGEACAALIDRDELEQIVLNLMLNARDAMPSGGRIVIRTEAVAVARDDAARYDIAAGDYVVISVRDTGCGMDVVTRARVFEAYFTTKAAGKGTGVGLATALDVARRNGGTIVVESEPGRGSTFRIYLRRVG